MPTKKNQKSLEAKPKIGEGSFYSGVGYVTILGWFVAYFGTHSEATIDQVFHLRQSLGLHMTMLAFEILGTFSMIPYFFVQYIWIVYIIVSIFFAIQAWRGKGSKVPFLGEKYQEWFLFL